MIIEDDDGIEDDDERVLCQCFFYNTFYENIRRGWRTEGNWELGTHSGEIFLRFFCNDKKIKNNILTHSSILAHNIIIILYSSNTILLTKKLVC